MTRTIGIVGCGSIGMRHLRNLLALDAGRVLVADPDPARRDAAIKQGAAEAVASPIDLRRVESLDAMLVCSPTIHHIEHSMLGMEWGLPVFVEKPLASDDQDPVPLIHAARRRDLPVFVGMVYRYHTGIRRLKGWLDEGAVGRVQFASFHGGHHLPDWRPDRDYTQTYSAQRALGGGVLLDSIHGLDLIRWLVGEPAHVFALVRRTGDLKVDVEDLVSAIFEVVSGTLVELHVDYLQRAKEDAILISGTEGVLRWDFVASELGYFTPERGWRIETFSTDVNEMYVEEMREFLRLLDGDVLPFVDGEHALATLGLVREIREASEMRRVVSHHP